MSTRSRIGVMMDDGTVKQVYCHWDGYVEEGVGNTQAPAGTYYYILHLNDPNYPEPLTGYLYLNK